MVRFKEDSTAARKLFQLFDRFVLNPDQGVDSSNHTADYIRKFVYPREQEFQEITIKNFYNGYRRFATKWQTQSKVAGQRRARQQSMYNALIYFLNYSSSHICWS